MPAFRFLHTSDLHLGKRFGRFEEETRMALQQGRQDILPRLAALAREHGAEHVLLAGDTFDTETPSDRVQRQALAAMGAAEDLNWWIIPGNHDSAAAEPLWAALAAHAPENVHLLMAPEPIEMAPGVVLLPAPCSHRFTGRDLTAWMDACDTPPGALRIGLAHGGVVDFGSEAGSDGAGETISPKRSGLARLDYLALGDWHGSLRVDERTHYSGTPEADRFKHAGRGKCLLVEISAAGQSPKVAALELGQYHWQEVTLDLTPTTDISATINDLLPAARAEWRFQLLRIRATGWASPPQRLALDQSIAGLAPEFCHLELVADDLGTEHDIEDLDMIGQGGALRVAAEDLMRAATDTALAEEDRTVASAALNRLYAYAQAEYEAEERP
jgi:DNA repair exonuclease SbcCD nuclease subunit